MFGEEQKMSNGVNIYIGADHAGFKLKEELKEFLRDLGYDVEDTGAYKFDENDDYPDFIIPVARAVAKNPEHNNGIVIGGSGQGEAMAANRIKGVRAALIYDKYSAKMSREHNNANIISLGARVLSVRKAKKLVKLWLDTPFSNGERHIRRIKKIDQ